MKTLNYCNHHNFIESLGSRSLLKYSSIEAIRRWASLQLQLAVKFKAIQEAGVIGDLQDTTRTLMGLQRASSRSFYNKFAQCH